MRSVLLLLLLGMAGCVAARSQPQPGGSATMESETPTHVGDGQLWTRRTDYQQFVFVDTLDKWLGEQIVIGANRNNANHTGVLRVGETGMNNASPFHGYTAFGDSLRIMRVIGKSVDVSTTCSCTTFVFSDADTVLKLVWDSNEELWTPGGSGWVSAAARVAIAPNKTMSVYVSAGGVLPDFPMMWFFLRPEVPQVS